jgi:hypothetical protein
MEQDLITIFSTGQTYLYLFNAYWLITDPDTLKDVFGDSPQTTTVASLPPGAVMGPKINPDSFIFSATPSGSLYFMCSGNLTCYEIANSEAQSYYQLNGTPKDGGQDKKISDWILASSAAGPSITVPWVASTLPAAA